MHVLLVTHNGFDAYLQQLGQVLSRLKEHNVQVHIEETFLTATHFYYLGCHVAPNDVKPGSDPCSPFPARYLIPS